jgi:hypothetical protein
MEQVELEGEAGRAVLVVVVGKNAMMHQQNQKSSY